MALGKVFIVLDFDNEQQKEEVQELLKEVSNERILTGRQVVSVAPMIRRNKDDLAELFSMIKNGGVKSLMSIRGGTLISRITKNK